jgi:hypothetical protein
MYVLYGGSNAGTYKSERLVKESDRDTLCNIRFEGIVPPHDLPAVLPPPHTPKPLLTCQ